MTSHSADATVPSGDIAATADPIRPADGFQQVNAAAGRRGDALEAKETNETAEPSDIDQLLETTSGAAWQPSAPIGEGEEYRSELSHGEQASALTFHDSLVHGNVLVAGSKK